MQPRRPSRFCLTPRSPTGSARANHAGADHPRGHRRTAAHPAHHARLRPPPRRDRDAPLRQPRLQRHRGLLRHPPAVCDPRTPATRHPARHRAGARIARTRGTGPRHKLRRTAPSARPWRRPCQPIHQPRRQPIRHRSNRPRRGNQPRRPSQQRSTPGHPARAAGTTPNCSCRHWRNSRRRCAAARSAAPWSRSASTSRWCPASAPVRSGTSCSTASACMAAASPR